MRYSTVVVLFLLCSVPTYAQGLQLAPPVLSCTQPASDPFDPFNGLLGPTIDTVILSVLDTVAASTGLYGDIKLAMFGQNMGESGFYGCTVGYCTVAAAMSFFMGPAAFVAGCTSAALICAIRHF